MALSPATYPPLLQVVSEAQTIPYSITLSVPIQPALPPTHPPLNTPLAYGVIRLPTGELPAATLPGLNGVVTKLDPIMWSRTLNWSWPQTLGQPQWPPILAPHSSTLQMQMKPLPMKLLTPTLQEDLLVGNHRGVTSSHWTNGDTTTGAASICRVYMPMFFSSHILCCTACTCRSELL